MNLGFEYSNESRDVSVQIQQGTKLNRNFDGSNSSLGVCAAETSGHDLAFVIGGQL